MCEDQVPKNEIGEWKIDTRKLLFEKTDYVRVLERRIRELEKLLADKEKEHDMNKIDIEKVAEMTQAFRDMTAAYKHLSKQFEE